jgi:DNA-binding MarR family transcriptional regulator
VTRPADLRHPEADPASDADATDEARVDLGHLGGLVGYRLRRAQLAAFRNFSRRFEDVDIRPTQLGVLTVVARNPGLTQSRVGAALGIKRANLVPLLNGLEDRGLVARRPSSDRRSHALHLTAEGTALFAELRRREDAHEAEITALIGETGRRRLVELLAAVEQACGADEEE